MKTKYLTLQFLFMASCAWCQFTGQYNALNVTGSTNTLKTEIPIAQPSWVGSSYWSETWSTATLFLKNQSTLENVPVRLETESGNVEVMFNGVPHFLDWKKLDKVLFTDERGSQWLIRNPNDYKRDGQIFKGIVRVLYEDEKYIVLRNYYVSIMRANYNVAVDVGNKDNRKIQKNKTYMRKSDQWIEVQGSAKKLLKSLGVSVERQKEILKSKDFDLKQDSDLVALLQAVERV